MFALPTLRCLILAITIVIACLTEVHAETDKAKTKIAKATVTDRDDNPIEGAKVVALHWFDNGDDHAADVLTNAKGEFEFAIKEKNPDESHVSNYVIIHKKGYAVGALNLDHLPARARLWPKKPVAVRLVDAQQKPLAGARVTLGEVGFNDEFLHANIPPSLAEEIGVISREDGWAILRSARPAFVHSVTVEAEGFGKQEFATRFAEQKFHVLQLWPTTPAKIRVMDGDQPAAGWKVFATTSDLLARDAAAQNGELKNPINDNLLPKGISLNETTDKDGNVEVKNALLRRKVHLMLIEPEGKWRGTGTLVAKENSPEPTIMQAQPSVQSVGKSYVANVLDASSGEPVSGVDVVFQSQELPPKVVSATSQADGKVIAKLCPGSWYVRVSKSPAGYCKTLTSQSQFVIPEHGELKLPDLRVPKGKTIEGSIRDVDLSIRRARWLNVGWTDKEEMSGTLNSRFRPDGSFSVTIPAGATAESFAIVAIGGGNDTLLIKSKDPLVLTSTAEQ